MLLGQDSFIEKYLSTRYNKELHLGIIIDSQCANNSLFKYQDQDGFGGSGWDKGTASSPNLHWILFNV